MKHHLISAIVILTLLFHSQLMAAGEKKQYITMNLPETVLAKALHETLPLQFETSSKTLEGTITIASIEQLKLENQQLSCLLKLSASDLHVVTKISGHPLRIKIGTVDLNFDTTAKLRFDADKQILFIKPEAKSNKTTQGGGANDIGQTLLALLNGREFPISLEKIEPILAQASNKQVMIQMNIANIRATRQALQLSLEPVITTTKKKGAAHSS